MACLHPRAEFLVRDGTGNRINRNRAGAHNGSKPLHETILIDLGFCVPESITSSDVDELRKFTRECPTISKTVCGVRADAAIVSEADFFEFEPKSGPVHLQRLITGADARLHVVGTEIIAQRLSANTIDYRREGNFDSLEMFSPPAPVCDLIREGTQRWTGIRGWDLRSIPTGNIGVWKLTLCPGYAPYDAQCQGAISQALLRRLGTAS